MQVSKGFLSLKYIPVPQTPEPDPWKAKFALWQSVLLLIVISTVFYMYRAPTSTSVQIVLMDWSLSITSPDKEAQQQKNKSGFFISS